MRLVTARVYGIIRQSMKAKYRHMRIDELQRAEKELRDQYRNNKQATLLQEIRELEAAIRDKIWNKGGAQWKKENVK